MRGYTDKQKLEAFMRSLGERVHGAGRIYLVGGATAVWYGWRESTIDIDLKAGLEPAGMFQAIASIKNEIDANVELASPDQFIPALPGWEERSRYIGHFGPVDFYHYDFYAQALAKLQRGHGRDRLDLEALARLGLIEKGQLRQLFSAIEPELIRYPAIDPAEFRRAVEEFCRE
ncbi:MAG: DUF6036 family nucleotidyltransferase [Terriglobales bacterium]